MLCPHCGQSLPDGSQFCFHCGRALSAESETVGALICPSCGRPLSSGTRFCTHCGTVIGQAANASMPAAKRGVPAWGWVLIGCGALGVLAMLVLALIVYFSARSVLPRMEQMSESQARVALTNLRNAVKAFHADCGAYPASLLDLAATEAPKEGLVAQGGKVVTAPIKPEAWRGPYLQPQVPTDISPASQETAIPFNFVTRGNREGRDWSYETSEAAKLGHLAMGPAATGKDANGKPYSEW